MTKFTEANEKRTGMFKNTTYGSNSYSAVSTMQWTQWLTTNNQRTTVTNIFRMFQHGMVHTGHWQHDIISSISDVSVTVFSKHPLMLQSIVILS